MPNNLGPASIPFMACVSLMLAMILQVLSFASPFWASDNKEDFGLWRHSSCVPTDQDKCRRYVTGSVVGEWLNAVRGLECISIILWSIPLVVIPVYIYVAMGLYYRSMMGTFTVFSFIATVCNLVGVAVYASEIEDRSWDAGWCIIVCAIAGGFGLISSIILLIAFFSKPKFELQRHFFSGFYVDPDRNRMYVVENIDEPVKQPPPVHTGQVNPTLVVD